MKKPTLIFFILFVSIFLINNNFSNAFSISTLDSYKKVSIINYQPHAPIMIDNESDLIHQANIDNWKGNGSAFNPYVIENYSFDNVGNINNALISIRNIQKFILIRNCNLNVNNSNAINLYNVQNLHIEYNEINSNRFGIVLFNVHHIQISNNNITNNAFAGFDIETNSSDITLNNNFFYKNNYSFFFFSDATSIWLLNNRFEDNDIVIKILSPVKGLYIMNNVFINNTQIISNNDKISSLIIENNDGFTTQTAEFPIFPVFIALVIISLKLRIKE